MDLKVENLKKGKLKLKFVLTPIEMVSYFNKSYKKIAPTIKIDGFRPGKAPRKLVESAAGISRLLSEGLNMAVSESYSKAIKDNKITPILSPNIVIVKYPNYGSNIDDISNNFEFEAEIEAIADIKLNDYSKVKVKKKEEKKAEEKDVEKVLEHFRKQNSTFSEIERGAEKGDRIEIDFEGFIKNVKIDQMCSKNHPILIGEGSLIPGFEDELIGLKKGDKKNFKIKFPADYHNKNYAGSEAEFKINVNDLKAVLLPELDEKFAQKFGHKDVKTLREAIENNLNNELIEESKRELEGQVLEAVLPFLSVTIPDTLIDREAERMIADFNRQLESRGLNLDRYLENLKKSREDMKKEMLPQAEKNVKTGLLLGKIIEKNKWDQMDQNAGKKAIDYLINQVVTK